MEEINNKKYGPDDTFKPIEMFPEGKDAINRTLPIWNFPEEKFYKQINVYIFIVASLTKGISDDILKKYVDYFGKTTILDAFEYHKQRVSLEFRNLVKEKILDII